MTQAELIEKRRIWKEVLVLLKKENPDEGVGLCYYLGEVIGHGRIPKCTSKVDRRAWPEFFKYQPKTMYRDTRRGRNDATLYWWAITRKGLARRINVATAIINDLKIQINDARL
jgi:hypothetical protein